jgi:hypothetical protein
MLNTPAYMGLSANARSLLEQLQMLENGKNNGSMFLSVRDAADLMGAGDVKTAQRAFGELIDHGFIRETQAASFHVKAGEYDRRARAWRLTWLPEPNRRGATFEFRDWSPVTGSVAAKRIERVRRAILRWGISRSCVGESTTLLANLPSEPVATVGDFPTVREQKSRIAVIAAVVESPTHAVCHTYGGARATLRACNDARSAALEWVAQAGHGCQQRLAASAGLSQARLSRFIRDERGRKTLTVDELARLWSAIRDHSSSSPKIGPGVANEQSVIEALPIAVETRSNGRAAA